MKKSFMMMMMAILSFALFAGEGDAISYNVQHGRLLVEIDGLEVDEGSLKVLLFNSERGFPMDEWHAMYALELGVDDVKKTVNFESIPFNVYALFVYHDANSNGKLDKNWAGIAKESYGFSNELSGVRSMPLFSDSAFTFDHDGQVVKIKMIDVVKKNGKPQVSKR